MTGIPAVQDRAGQLPMPAVLPLNPAYAGLPLRAQRLLTLNDATDTPVNLDGTSPICASCQERYDTTRAKGSPSTRPYLCKRCSDEARILEFALTRPVRWSPVPETKAQLPSAPICAHCFAKFTPARAQDKRVKRPWLCPTSEQIVEATLRAYARSA